MSRASVAVVLAAACVLLATAIQSTLASLGDSQPIYMQCVAKCEKRTPTGECSLPSGARAATLGLWSWPCDAECRYRCMHAVEEEREKIGLPVVQYHGKWPFERIAGVQEPFSTLFSVLNGWGHARRLAFPELRAELFPSHHARDQVGGKTEAAKESTFISWAVVVGAVVACNTWLWSAVFHARDNVWTERLDYHFATAHMCYFLWLAVLRLTYQVLPERLKLVGSISGGAIFVWLMRHVWYLNAVKFDYGYNMKATGIIVILQVGAWIAWAIIFRFKSTPSVYKSDKRPYLGGMFGHELKIVVFQVLLLCFASLELLDFPPIWKQLDAHAMWHGLTVPLGFLFYNFHVDDAAVRARTNSNDAKIL